ncbi:MAG TPA: ChaN family lipoprotein [Burkholderiaceae bacterium]
MTGAAVMSGLVAACAVPPAQREFAARTLATQMQRQPVVLLGEIHDNGQQHAVRAQALALVLQAGLRPALAFEQFDRERQGDIDRVLAEGSADGSADDRHRVDQLVALGGRGWPWELYRPFLTLALQYRLPMVAANLSRADAMRVAKEGFGAVFKPAEQRQLGLDPLPAELLHVQQQEVDQGHCHQIAEPLLSALARAQIARDAAIAQAISPYLERGVILLTGNGHARRDIGVPHFLSPREQQRVVSIALIERDTPAESVPAGAYDAVFQTPVQPREDPCESLRDRIHPTPAR